MFIYSWRTEIVFSLHHIWWNASQRTSVVWIIIKADGLIPCFLFSPPANVILWVWKLHKLLFGNQEQSVTIGLPCLCWISNERLSSIPDHLCTQKETERKANCMLWQRGFTVDIFRSYFEWGTLVTRTQEDTLFPSFSVNNRLSLFIPLPFSVPPSPAFSFSPLSLWLCASQHQRESSDLWPQQPTLNLAKEGEHPVCSLAGPK